MKLYISNPELDAKIAEIRKIIRLSMNGIVSEQMAKKGIIYKKNYGVSIPRIKEIAKNYTPNHDLAQRLWMLQIRETMILGTLLEPIDKFTPKLAQEWVECFDQIEIVEQCCMNIFCKLPFATTLVMDWTESDKKWIQITGFVLAARLVDDLKISEIKELTKNIIEHSDTDELHLYKAMALCLSRSCRKDKATATYILKEVESNLHSTSTAKHYITNEVKQEIFFLDIL